MKKTITINDVARAAGVSASTVSHAISGKRPISSSVKHKIFEKIKELNYKPNFFAHSMRIKETNRIGIVTDGIINPQSAALVQMFINKLAELSYETITSCPGLDQEHGRTILSMYSSGLVDGIINMLPQIDTVEARMICGNTPVITYIRDDYAPMIIDYNTATITALKEFLDHGHRRIGYITSTLRHYKDKDSSIDCYIDFLNSNGIKVQPGWIVFGDDTIEGGAKAAEQLFAATDVTAIFAGNDQMALGVYQKAYANGMTIPGDLSVIGLDDMMQAAVLFPPLTTLRYDRDLLTSRTVEAIIAKIGNRTEPFERQIVPLEMIRRGSVAAPRN